MARKPQDTDFVVNVEGVGSFTFGRRTMRDEIAAQVEFARIIDGVQPTEWLKVVAGCISALRVMTVRAPADWDIEGMDPTDDETYAKLVRVHQALIEKERSFRRKPEPVGEGSSASAG